MTLPAPGSCEEPALIAPADEAADPLQIGLPAAWWPTISAAAFILFAIIWMMESWEKAAPLKGPTKVNYLMQDLAALLAVLACICAVHWYWKHRAAALGPILGLAVAAAAMALHRM